MGDGEEGEEGGEGEEGWQDARGRERVRLRWHIYVVSVRSSSARR